MRYLWAGLGILSVGLGVIGAFLPLLPTVPFLLLAAFLFSQSSPRLHNWILSHRQFGPLIEDWNRSGVIRPRAKRLATLSIVAVFGISLALDVKTTVLIIQAVVLSCVLIFLWTRPSR